MPTAQHWEDIKQVLFHYIKNTRDEDNVEWIINAQYASISSPTYYHQFTAKEDSGIADLDKYSFERRLTSSNSSPTRSQSESESNESPIRRKLPSNFEGYDSPIKQTTPSERSQSNFMSPKAARSSFFDAMQTKLSAKLELRRNITNQLSNPTHIIIALIKIFISAVRKIYGPDLDLPKTPELEVYEALYESLSLVTANFITVLQKFIMWIYEDLLVQIENGLGQEDINPGYVTESIIYDILFRMDDSVLIKYFYKTLAVKHSAELARFREAIKLKKGSALASYDDVLKNSSQFLLEGAHQPYQAVINKLKALELDVNPYTKFERLISLEEDMWGCVSEHYSQDPVMLNKLRESFGMDLRLPITVFSIVESQCESLFLERRIIEQFVYPQMLETSMGFTTLKSCLDYLVYDLDQSQTNIGQVHEFKELVNEGKCNGMILESVV